MQIKNYIGQLKRFKVPKGKVYSRKGELLNFEDNYLRDYIDSYYFSEDSNDKKIEFIGPQLAVAL